MCRSSNLSDFEYFQRNIRIKRSHSRWSSSRCGGDGSGTVSHDPGTLSTSSHLPRKAMWCGWELWKQRVSWNLYHKRHSRWEINWTAEICIFSIQIIQRNIETISTFSSDWGIFVFKSWIFISLNETNSMFQTSISPMNIFKSWKRIMTHTNVYFSCSFFFSFLFFLLLLKMLSG